MKQLDELERWVGSLQQVYACFTYPEFLLDRTSSFVFSLPGSPAADLVWLLVSSTTLFDSCHSRKVYSYNEREYKTSGSAGSSAGWEEAMQNNLMLRVSVSLKVC